MKNFTDKEFHPVIEDFVSEFAEDRMGPVEREAFGEVLVHDDDIRELAFHAKGGREMLQQLREQSEGVREGFLNRLRTRIAAEKG